MYKMILLSLLPLSINAFSSTQVMPTMEENKPTIYMTSTSSSYHSSSINGEMVSQKSELSVNHVLSSKYDFSTTISRLEKAFAEKNLMIFSKIDHQQAAKEKGLDMQPAVVLIFGNPQAGTPHMKKDPFFALELPLKVLVTQTQDGIMVVFKNTQSLIKNTKITQQDVANNLAKVELLITQTVTQ